MIIDFNDKVLTEKYALMSQLIIPRPIVWIVTEGEVLNLAPFSYFTGLSSNPPTMIVSIGAPSRRYPERYTAEPA